MHSIKEKLQCFKLPADMFIDDYSECEYANNILPFKRKKKLL